MLFILSNLTLEMNFHFKKQISHIQLGLMNIEEAALAHFISNFCCLIFTEFHQNRLSSSWHHHIIRYSMSIFI